MALTVDQANTVSNHGLDKMLKQQVYESSPLLTKLQQGNKVKADGGTDIRFNIRYAKLGRSNTVGSREQITFGLKDTRTAAFLDWAYYEGDTMITWDERVKNTGKSKIIDLITDKTKELKEDFYDRVVTDIFTTNPKGGGIIALPVIVDATTTYAGVAKTDATVWVASEYSRATLSLFTGTSTLAYAVSHATFGKDHPTIHITTRDLQNKFEAAMYTNIRYEDKDMANAGFANVTFRDAPVIGDYACPASTWYGLDTNNMELRYHPDYDMVVSEWKEIDIAGFPNALVKIMTWAGNLVCKSRQTCFKFTALAG